MAGPIFETGGVCDCGKYVLVRIRKIVLMAPFVAGDPEAQRRLEENARMPENTMVGDAMAGADGHVIMLEDEMDKGACPDCGREFTVPKIREMVARALRDAQS